MKSKIIGAVCGICLVIVGIIIISQNNKVIDYKNRSVDDWYNDIMNNKEVLTVYGASFCSHCKDYYPVISALAKKYNINLYFFEIDVLKEKNNEDYEKLMNSFEIKEFEGSVPFTYYMKDGDYKDSTTGFISRENTIEFLKQCNIIKD